MRTLRKLNSDTEGKIRTAPTFRYWPVSDGRAVCPLWVKFGSRRSHRRGLLCPHKRTSSVRPVRSEKCHFQTHASQRIASYSITLSKRAHHAHSGNPALRRPSISSKNDSPPRAINADIVKAGSTSSKRAAASCASASRPRWAKADARHW